MSFLHFIAKAIIYKHYLFFFKDKALSALYKDHIWVSSINIHFSQGGANTVGGEALSTNMF